MKRFFISVVLLVCVMGLVCCKGKVPHHSYDNINEEIASKMIDVLTSLIEKDYIEESLAIKMAEKLRKEKESLVKIKDPVQLAQKITNYLRSISDDKHLMVNYSPQIIKEIEDEKNNPEKYYELELKRAKAFDYGIPVFKVLEGNIGYIQIIQFCKSDDAFARATEAMKVVENCDAVIIDLRRGRGGYPEMEQYICSYFLPEAPQTNFGKMVFRDSSKNYEQWSVGKLPSKRLLDNDLYILTSETTFSAQEGVVYNLKHLKRAKIIGQKTAGGANAYTYFTLHDNFFVALPISKGINAVTQTNWERVGIETHVKTDFQNAFRKAYELALTKRNENENSKEVLDNSRVFQTWWKDRGILGKYGNIIEINMKRGRLYFNEKDDSMFDGLVTNQLVHKDKNEFYLLFNNRYNSIKFNLNENNEVFCLTLIERKSGKTLTFEK